MIPMKVNVYKISGKFRSQKKWVPFTKYVRAVKTEDAMETVYSELGSQHRVKRPQIKIEQNDVEIIKNPDEIKDIFIHGLTTLDDLKL